MNNNRLKSARINSSCVIRNNQKYQVTNAFPTAVPSTSSMIQQQIKKECPFYQKYQQRAKTPLPTSLIDLKDIPKQQTLEVNNHKDYKTFIKKKQSFVNEHHAQLKGFLYQQKSYDRRYFKNYKQDDKLFFKHSKPIVPEAEFQATGIPTCDALLGQNNDNKQLSNRRLYLEKKKKQIKQEDQEEKEYLKSKMESYMQKEQLYFHKLDEIGNKGLDKFSSVYALKNKYFFENLEQPASQFTLKQKDLYLPSREPIIDMDSKATIHKEDQRQQACSSIPYTLLNSPMQSYNLITTQLDIPSYNNIVLNKSIQDHLVQPQQLTLFSQQEQKLQDFYTLIALNKKELIKVQVISDPSLLLLKDQNGATPLHFAITKGRIGLAKYFLKKGIKCDEVDKKGQTADYLAQKYNFEQLIQFIKQFQKLNDKQYK